MLTMFHLSCVFMALFVRNSFALSNVPTVQTGSPNMPKDEVSVCVKKRIPNVSPHEAFQGFIDFTWEKGGGLPVICTMDKDDPSERNLLLFGEETLMKSENSFESSDSSIVQQYKLTKLGLIWKTEIEPGSHLGTVSFSSFAESDGSSGTELTWDTSFKTIKRNSLWQAVTESSILDACDNLVAYLSEPLMFTLKLPIETELSHEELAKEWFDFVWRKGGGVPLTLPPFSFQKDGYDRLLIPPFLKERIIEIKEGPEQTEVYYTVVNPSLFTFFPVYTHLGRVTFQKRSSNNKEKDAGVELIWQASVRPQKGLTNFVVPFLETIISILTRNFKSHMMDREEEKNVEVFLPRGLRMEKGPLFQVRKETWLGSVLYEHRKDTRSTIDQTKDLFAPWRWGAQGDDWKVSWGVGGITADDNAYRSRNEVKTK